MLDAHARKAEMQPSNSFDSAQTGPQACQHRQAGRASPNGLQSSSHSFPLLAPAHVAGASNLEPMAAKLAIREALAPLGPAQLAKVQEQLRQSRLARQQEAWGSAACVHDCSASTNHATAPCCRGGITQLVERVASALSQGHLAPGDVAHVLSNLDPSLLQPGPHHQQEQLQSLCAPHPLTLWQPQHGVCPPVAPAAGLISSLAAYHDHAPPPLQTPFQQHDLPLQPSAVAPYHAVLSSLQLPLTTLAGQESSAAGFTAAAEAAEAAAAFAAAGPSGPDRAGAARHPGSSTSKGRRGRRRARGHCGSLLRSVSAASDAARQEVLRRSPSGTRDQVDLLKSVGVCLKQQQQQQSEEGACAHGMLHLLAPQDSSTCWPQRAWAAPAPSDVVDEPVMQDWLPAGFSHTAALDVVAATAAAAAEALGAEDHPALANATSLKARFARLAPSVQALILQELDELSAVEEELQGGGPWAGGAPELQGPRRRSGARKVRNLDAGGSTPSRAAAAAAAAAGHDSRSPTPPPTGASTDDLPTHHYRHQQQHQHDSSSSQPKRLRLDATSAAPSGAQLSVSPEASSARRAAMVTPEQDDAPPALDLFWALPGGLVLPLPDPQAVEVQPPRKRRVPRRVGPRASARKCMHRGTFRRGKPQRAPAV